MTQVALTSRSTKLTAFVVILAPIVVGLFWNDPRLTALNLRATLPALATDAFHRADSSGTMNTFTTHLPVVSPDCQ